MDTALLQYFFITMETCVNTKTNPPPPHSLLAPSLKSLNMDVVTFSINFNNKGMWVTIGNLTYPLVCFQWASQKRQYDPYMKKYINLWLEKVKKERWRRARMEYKRIQKLKARFPDSDMWKEEKDR